MNKINFKSYVPAVLFVFLVGFSFFIIKPLLLAIFLGALLAYIFYPLYKQIGKRLGNKTVAALLLCLVILILVIIPSVFFVKTLVQESYSLYVLGKQKISGSMFRECGNYFCELIDKMTEKPEVRYYFQEGLRGVTNWVIKKGSELLVSIPKVLLNLFVIFFVLFYFLKDGAFFMRKMKDYLSMHKRIYGEMVRKLEDIIHALIYGYVLVALMQGALGALGFFLFGVSSPLFWGMVMAFLALIPYLGTGLVWGPAALFLFLDGIFQNSNPLIYKGIGLFFYGLIIVGSIDNFLKPKIIGAKAKVHPALILIGIFGGILLVGPLGVIVGPLVLSLTAVMVEVYLSKNSLGKRKKEI